MRFKTRFLRAKASRGRGSEAESLALEYLKDHGLQLVERNFRCRGGEIDLIMEQDEMLVFVEVRYRASPVYGSAQESVDFRKQGRITHCASHYLSTKKISPPVRFDVVALSPEQQGIDIRWIKDAFQG